MSIGPAPSQQSYNASSRDILIIAGAAGVFLFLGVLAIVCSGITLVGDSLPAKAGRGFKFGRAFWMLAPEDLDFSSGFTSTVTVASATVAAIVAASVIPAQTTWLSKDSYVALNVIFVAMIALAALIFKAFQTECAGKLHGYVIAFLAAAGITTFAVFGELLTLWYLVWDINGTKGFTPVGTAVLEGIVVTAGLTSVLYLVRRSMQITAGAQERSARESLAKAEASNGQPEVSGLRVAEMVAVAVDAGGRVVATDEETIVEHPVPGARPPASKDRTPVKRVQVRAPRSLTRGLL